MAVAVINLLALDGVSDFVGRAASTAIAIRAANRSGTGLVAVRVDDAFADVTLNEPRAVDDAVSRLFELGIAKGTSEGVFSPDAEVTRGQMAAFITRALAFTSARPVGVSIAPGAVAGMYDVSVRDADFGPVINARVDFFYVSGEVSGALNADGTCDTDVVESDGDDPARECVIDAVDLTTDGRGDATIDISGVTPTADSPLTVWAWTGDIGDEVQQGTQIASYVATADAAGPEAFTVKRSTPTRFARMGSEVTVTIQLVDSGTGLNDVARAGYNFNIGIEAWKDTRDDRLLNPGATGTTQTFETDLIRFRPPLISADAVDNVNIQLQARRVVSVTTDESGQATFTVGGAQDNALDPDLTRNSRDTLVVWGVQHAPPQAGASAITAVSDPDHNQQSVIFADSRGDVLDDTPGTSSITAKPVTPFNRVGDNVTAYVDVTVLGAYGDPIAGQALQLVGPSISLTNITLDTGKAANRYTSRSGTVRLSYTRDGGDPVQGTIRVGLADEEGNAQVAAAANLVTALWVDDPADTDAEASANAYTILAVDAASNAVVVDSDTNAGDPVVTPWVLTFDSDDRFVGLEGPTDMAGLVKAITDDLQDGSPSLTLEWDFRSATKNTTVLWTLTSRP